MSNENKFKKILLGENRDAVSLEHLWADVYGLKIKITAKESLMPLRSAFGNLIKDAESFQAKQILFRLVRDEFSDEIRPWLSPLGFTFKNERVEFQKAVSELPEDAGSPLRWKSALELSWTPQDIAQTLKLVAEGDPDTDPNEDPLSFIQDFLHDPVLTAGLNCIHVGFLKDEIAAFTVVQINPKTGWSRISYMGIAPKWRHHHLGQWVHRYSFKVMKESGAKLYHGGTGATNISMIRLFEKHQCDRFRTMEEWIYSVEATR